MWWLEFFPMSRIVVISHAGRSTLDSITSQFIHLGKDLFSAGRTLLTIPTLLHIGALPWNSLFI